MLKNIILSLACSAALASCSMSFNGSLNTSGAQSESAISGATKTSNNVGSNSGVVSSGSSIVNFQSDTVSASTQSIEPASTSDEFIFREPNGPLQVRYPQVFENATISSSWGDPGSITYSIEHDPLDDLSSLGTITRISKGVSISDFELIINTSALICENENFSYYYTSPHEVSDAVHPYINAIEKLGYVDSAAFYKERSTCSK